MEADFNEWRVSIADIREKLKTIETELFEVGRISDSAIYIYTITNLSNGKIYVGSTHEPEKRFQSHLTCLRSKKHSVTDMVEDFHNGYEFEFKVIDKYESESNRVMEYYYMILLGTCNRGHGYNYKDRGSATILRGEIPFVWGSSDWAINRIKMIQGRFSELPAERVFKNE